MEWHPYADTFPLLEGQDYADLKADIQAHGVRNPIVYRVVLNGREYLDGRNRARACDDSGIACPERSEKIDDDSVADWIDSQNHWRRHLTPEWRRAKVAARRAEGQSVREISEALDVSKSTVHRDIENQVSHRGTPDTTVEKVKGKDGRNYEPVTKKRCSRCDRIGRPVPDCPACKELNRKGARPMEVKVHERIREIIELIPAFGPCFAKMLEAANSLGAIERTNAYSFVMKGDCYSGTFREALTYLKEIAPLGPCPECMGTPANEDNEDCPKCAGRGYMVEGPK